MKLYHRDVMCRVQYYPAAGIHWGVLRRIPRGWGGCSTCYHLLVTPKSVGNKTAVLCGYSGHAHVQSSEQSEGLEATFPAEADDSRTLPSGLSSHTVNKHPFHSI